MDLNTTAIANKPKFTKAIHKEADTGPGSADHIRQCVLSNGRDICFLFAGLAEFRHDQKNSRQALFTGVEKLIDEICLGSHAARQQELEEYVGELGLVMYYASAARKRTRCGEGM